MSKQKYTIADVQQEKLIEYDLDIKDAFILTYLKEIFQVKKIIEKVIEGQRYIWVDYQKLISYLPVLKISSEEVIGRRMSKYEKLGLIKRHLHRSLSYGTYTFFSLDSKFNSLFEIEKTEYEDIDLEKIKKQMGLISPQSTFQSGGFDSKVESQSTQKSAHNTPTNNTPIKDKSSSMPAAPSEEFEEELKKLLPNFSIQHLNKNSIKNIKKYSRGDISQVEKVLKFMHLKNKSMTPDILVAILRDGDHTKPESIKPKEIKRNDKIKFMSEKLGEKEIKRLRSLVINDIGFEGEYVERELGNVLCKKYNELMREGSLNVS
ncbi:hypothetical protein [uncultured Ilyobacter sp.]|uniref:hypothetical protein n=1 Tax=uncultured Ilyobacter sp. TaxID=544433 RepID=UPI0029C657D5|nr:hypothetical protein [uncultured Ilyobacter sp.]